MCALNLSLFPLFRNSSNAEALLRYISGRPQQQDFLAALQLGNEPGVCTNTAPIVSRFCSTVGAQQPVYLQVWMSVNAHA